MTNKTFKKLQKVLVSIINKPNEGGECPMSDIDAEFQADDIREKLIKNFNIEIKNI